MYGPQTDIACSQTASLIIAVGILPSAIRSSYKFMTPVLNARRLRGFQVVRFWICKETMKVRDVIAMVEADGSHRQYGDPAKLGIVTVAGHLSDEMDRGTLGNILRVARLKKPRR